MIKSELIAIKNLIPHPRNYNRHSDRQLSNLTESLTAFGQFKNIVIDGHNRIIAGHGIVEAAKRHGMTHIEVKRYAHLSETQILALLIADNEIARQAEADNIALAELLDEIQKAGEAVPGMDKDALDEILGSGSGSGSGSRSSKKDPDLGINESLATEWGVEEGQFWKLGNHRLVCGDSTSKDTLLKLLDGEQISENMIVLTDPPYGVNIVNRDGTIGGGGLCRPNVYPQIIGDESTKTCQRFYETAKEIGLKKFILWGGNYYTDFVPPSPGWIVWDKGIPEGMDFADFEMAWTSYNRSARLYRWRWAGFVREGNEKKELKIRIHPTQKPVGLHEKIMLDFEGTIYIDAFLGSGSVLIAAETLGRRCFGIELSIDYVAAVLQRFFDFTGVKPTLVTSWDSS